MNITLVDPETFRKKMEKLGYEQISDRFLVKQLDASVLAPYEYTEEDLSQVNITIDYDTVIAITGYSSDDKVETIPDGLVTSIESDINNSNN